MSGNNNTTYLQVVCLLPIRQIKQSPGVVTNRADPKLGHIDGLNLSRAWMLEGMAHALGLRDRRTAALEDAARRHREAALPHVTGAHYEGGHWLGTFAVYLESRAGITAR